MTIELFGKTRIIYHHFNRGIMDLGPIGKNYSFTSKVTGI